MYRKLFYPLLMNKIVFTVICVTWQIGRSSRYRFVSVRNLIEFTSRIHFNNPH